MVHQGAMAMPAADRICADMCIAISLAEVSHLCLMRSVSLSIPPGLRSGKPLGDVCNVPGCLAEYCILGPVPANVRNAKQDFVGIGIALIKTQAGTNAVVQVWPGSPAEIAGIRPNDVLHTIDDVYVLEAPIETLQEALRGPEGSTVYVSVVREHAVQDVGPIKRQECQSVKSLEENFAQLRNIFSEQRCTGLVFQSLFKLMICFKGLEEVLSKLNQTSIEMKRERELYREELLKSYAKEQSALQKVQHLSDLLLKKMEHQSESGHSMQKKLEEISKMHQEVSKSFESMQWQIVSIQDDFKSIQEWSQNSDKKYGKQDVSIKNSFVVVNFTREDVKNLLEEHRTLVSTPFARVKTLSDQLQCAKLLLGKSQDLLDEGSFPIMLKIWKTSWAARCAKAVLKQSTDLQCNFRSRTACIDDSSCDKQTSEADPRISKQQGVFSSPIETETSYTMAPKAWDQCRIACGSLNFMGRILFNGKWGIVCGIARRFDYILSKPQIDLERIHECIIIIDQKSENLALHTRKAILEGATSIIVVDDGNLDPEVVATISKTTPIFSVPLADAEKLSDGSEISIQCSPRGSESNCSMPVYAAKKLQVTKNSYLKAKLLTKITDEHCSIDRLSFKCRKHEDTGTCNCNQVAGNQYNGGLIPTQAKRYDSGQVSSLKDAQQDFDNFQVSTSILTVMVKVALYQQALEQVGHVELPPGWNMRMSRSRNQVFYYNKETREKRWAAPEFHERHRNHRTPPIAPQCCPCGHGTQPHSPLSITTQMQLGIADEISLCAESSVAGDLTRCESGVSPTLDAYASDCGMEMKIPPWPQDLISAMSALARIFVGGRQIVCTRAEFGMQVNPQFSNMIIKGKVVRTQPWLANAALENVEEIRGCIAIIGRGGCPFTEKARRAEEAGAKAVVIVNHADFLFNVLGKVSNINIPVVSITKSDGESLQSGMLAVIQWGENPKKALEDVKNMEMKELAEQEDFPYSFRLTSQVFFDNPETLNSESSISQLVEGKDIVPDRRTEFLNLTVI
eukprot:763482-Hanusia_phi.AAC.7